MQKHMSISILATVNSDEIYLCMKPPRWPSSKWGR